jgi:hypothetical protein
MIFSSNYLKTRNQYIIPLIDYGVKRGKSQHWILKDVISTQLISLNQISSTEIDIEIPKDIFYKSLVCEIELFLNKSIIQLINCYKSNNQSLCWRYVTSYYLWFFCTTTLFRFLHRGFTFFHSTNIKSLELFSSTVHSNLIKLNSGNYYFSVIGTNSYDDLIIKLVHQGDNLHKLTGLQLNKIMVEFNKNAADEEKVVLAELLQLSNKLGIDFHSKLRNDLNYSALPSIPDDFKIGRQLWDLEDNYVTKLLRNDYNISPENKMLVTSFFIIYLLSMNLNLYEDYFQRGKYGRDFTKERENILHVNAVTVPRIY